MRLLVFQHIDCEHPGRLREYLAADGVDWTAVELDAGEEIPDLEPFDALWVMGGPMDVWDVEANPWLVAEKEAIRRWVTELRRPFLGLCLGHQLLADALGGTCGPQSPPEIGVMDVHLTEDGINDPIFADMSQNQVALQWHSVCVAQPPAGVVVLASSPDCAIQAMRYGRHAWSMQYHVEVESDTVANWAVIPEYRAALEATLGPGAAEALQAEAESNMETFAAASNQLYKNFRAAIVPGQNDVPKTTLNQFGQPVGWDIKVPAAKAEDLKNPMSGTHCRLDPLAAETHGKALFTAYTEADDDRDWTYLPYGPFSSEPEFMEFLGSMQAGSDPMFFAIVDNKTGEATGVASYLRIDDRNAVVEVGHIHLSRRMQRTPASTEAMYLMMKRAFDSGYRRYEWKCDDLNLPSRAAAVRLGFSYEGTFRQATHYKGRNRDTAWFAVLDHQWPDRRAEFERWLAPSNFDAEGRQQTSLKHH